MVKQEPGYVAGPIVVATFGASPQISSSLPFRLFRRWEWCAICIMPFACKCYEMK